MTVQETLNALGQWEIDLLPTIPREKLDALQFFGHVAIVHGRVDPAVYGDSLLAPGVARYVGVLRTNSLSDDARTKIPNDNVKIGGVGMAMWLGDQDNKGSIIENATTFATGSLFPNVIRGLLPASGAVTEGTFYSVPGTYSGTHQWQSPLQAIQYVCDTMSTPSAPVGWRVNNNGTLDAGPEANLYVTTPQATIVARGDGQDMSMLGIPGNMDLDADVEDYTTRVVLLAQGDGASIATGSADLAPGSNPYKDLHGNAVKLTRLVSESDTTAPNAPARAALALGQYTTPKQDLRLSIQDYDVEGTFSVGDYIYAYDPDKDLVDTSVELVFRGQRLNPIKLQVTEIQWAVTADYTVAYRAADGTWTDITDHIEINDAGTYVTVGGFARPLVGGGEPVGSRPNQDTSVPGVPHLVTPFLGAAYLDSRGFTRARVAVTWNAPLNVDGSTIRDGDHYEIRYAVDTDLIYPATWSQVSQIRWEDMQIWAQPFAAPTGQWQTMVVGWDQTSAQLQDLSPGIGYDVQIRAVDSVGNTGAWSATTTFVATSDNIPPSTPAAPTVAASRIAVQVTHTLGVASGGTFNLESDLDHLEIHAQYEPSFTPTDATLLGKLKANAGMIQAEIPAVGTYQVDSTVAVYVRVVAVDISGNRSGPSDAASATALLIDDAHISDLTVSKVTAGTIQASWVMAGEIKTADTGARARLSSAGIELYDAAGTRTLYGNAADGSVTMVGELRSTLSSGSAMVVNPAGAPNPEMRFYSADGSAYARIFSNDQAITPGPDAAIVIRSSPDGSNVAGMMYTRTVGVRVGMTKFSNGYYNAGGYLDTSSTHGEVGCQDELGGTLYSKFEATTSGARIAGTMRGPSGSDDAIVMGESGSNSATVFITSYGVTLPSNPHIVATINSVSSSGGSWISARATSNFTMTRELNTGSCTVSFWAWMQ
jgi:Fibronectin type III domain.